MDIIRARRQTRFLLQLAAGLVAMALTIAGMYSWQSRPASAVTPPDSCFAFSAGTITDYYDNEGNDPINPACPRAVDIPSTIGGVVVTAIGSNAFQGKQLTAVNIPNSVTTLGARAFRSNQISSLTLPDTITSIGTASFQLNNLTSVSIPLNWSSVPEAAFHSNDITSVTIPSNITYISHGAFDHNEITDLIIPDTVTSIGFGAFGNNRIASLYLSTNLTSIGQNTFINNQLETLVIPDGVTSIGFNAFRGNDIVSLSLPASVNAIGSNAFSDNQLSSVTIPNESASLQHSNFANNPLTSITVGGVISVQSSIAEPACFSTTDTEVTGYYKHSPVVAQSSGVLCGEEVVIPEGVTSIGDYAFYDDDLDSVNLPESLIHIGHMAFYANNITELYVGANVETIDYRAFGYNQVANPVFAGDNLVVVGDRVLYDNPIETITVLGTVYDQSDSISHEACFAFNAATGAITGYHHIDLKTIVSDQVVCWGGDLTIPSTIDGVPVTSIGSYALDAYDITGVILPDGLESIGQGAFMYNKVTEIILPDSVTTVAPTAFALQSKWGMAVDDSRSEAPYIWSSDPAEVQEVYDSVWYVRLHTNSPSNPNDITNGTMSEDWWLGWDANDNGVDDSLGGHIVNSASLTLNYRNNGTTLMQPRMLVGELAQRYLYDYMVATGPVVPQPANLENPTPEEMAAMDLAFAAYYRVGQTVTIDPPAIAGYTAPPAQVFTLAAASNEVNVVYAVAGSSDADSGGGTLADTGDDVVVVASLAVAMIAVAGVTLRRVVTAS